MQFALPERLSQAKQEPFAEEATEDLDRKEERLVTGDPPRVVGADSAAGNHAMNMGMGAIAAICCGNVNTTWKYCPRGQRTPGRAATRRLFLLPQSALVQQRFAPASPLRRSRRRSGVDHLWSTAPPILHSYFGTGFPSGSQIISALIFSTRWLTEVGGPSAQQNFYVLDTNESTSITAFSPTREMEKRVPSSGGVGAALAGRHSPILRPINIVV
jgi:hypothetical protein